MSAICTCKYCRDIDYDNSEYFVDIAFLHKERPVGVTGLLRVKDDAEFLALCIDSCIDALDELVIVYQACSDDSPRIIEEKRHQYPDKIRSYYYRPHILSHNLSKEEFQYVRKLPSDSVHLLANYYNYTLSKASYKYAVKIDADQIYFSDKLRRICDAYRSKSLKRHQILEISSYYILRLYNKFSIRFPKLFPSALWSCEFSLKITRAYEQYIIKTICNKKEILTVSGINLFHDNNGWSICLNGKKGVLPPFNGVGDTVFFEISPETYFVPFEYPCSGYEDHYKTSYIEIMKKPHQRILYGGFLWYHMAALRNSIRKKNELLYKNRTLPWGNFICSHFSIFNKTNLFPFMKPYFAAFFEMEKSSFPNCPKREVLKW